MSQIVVKSCNILCPQRAVYSVLNGSTNFKLEVYLDVSSALYIKIFETVFPLFAIVLIGFFYARARPTDMTITNRVNMSVFTPALVFSVMASKNFQIADYHTLIMAGAVIIVGSGIVLLPVCRLFGLSVKTFLPPMMFNNSGNLGIPLFVLAFGESALPIAVILFLTENILHFTLGIYLMNPKANPINIIKMPMVLATILGVFWSLNGWTLPVALSVPLEMIGQIAIPLMLFALGVRMTLVDLKNWRIGVLGGVLCPVSGLIVLFIWNMLVPLSSDDFMYLLIFACLPPAVLNYMVAELYQQEPQKVASIVLIGNVFSLFFIPLMLFFVL